MRSALSVFILLLALFATSAHAQRAIEGAEAHPLVPLPPDGYITLDNFVDYAELTFPAGPVEGRSGYTEQLEVAGAHRQMEYTVDGTETAMIRLYRSYLQYFEGNAFDIVFTGVGADLSIRDGYTFLTAERDLLTRTPATTSGTIAYLLARTTADHPHGKDVVVSLSFFNRQNNRRIMVNALEVEDMDTVDLFAPAVDEGADTEAGIDAEIDAETLAALQQDTEELESGLLADGRVVVNAILFAFDSDEILPESAQGLETVAALLGERPNLRLLVVGHTDGIGSFDYNLRLSMDRATAVVERLRDGHGIDGARLRPAGAGPISPITTNRTEEGRALNRRVELVEVID